MPKTRTASRELGMAERIAAACLAVIWIGAGVTGLAIGILGQRWAGIVIGPLAIWFGLVWARVAREGHLLRWPEGLLPWR